MPSLQKSGIGDQLGDVLIRKVNAIVTVMALHLRKDEGILSEPNPVPILVA